MDLVILDNVGYSPGGKEIFEKISFTITDRTRLALLGRNGTGKTTLLRLIAGEIEPTSGNIFRKGGIRIGFLHQEQGIEDGGTVFESVLKTYAPWWKLYVKLASPDIPPAEYDSLMVRFEALGGYEILKRCEILLEHLGIDSARQKAPVATFSGGERNRAAIASVLLPDPDLILLDEPTNHIDYEGLVWLAKFLQDTKKPFVVVSHDRHFLNIAVSQTAEIIDGRFYVFPGNYSAYRLARQQLIEQQRERYRRQMEFIERTEEFIRRNIAGQKTRQAQSRRKLLEKMERVEVIRDGEDLKLRMRSGVRGGDKVLEIRDLSYSYGDRVLFRDFSAIVKRGEKIGIVGKNGCGKTTFLRLLVGELPFQTGQVVFGANISYFYYSQDFVDIPADRTPMQIISDAAPYLAQEQVRAHLAAFSVRGDDAFRPIRTFSGGERSRVAMAQLVLTRANLLLLDEPTNHLDIPSRQVLERALAEYDGTVLVVSHDRFFLDAVVNKIWAFEDGRINEYVGNFSYYLEKSAGRQERNAVVGSKFRVGKSPPRRSSGGISKNMLSRLKRRLERIESEIEALETERQKLVDLMSEPFVAADFARVSKISGEIEQIDRRLGSLWEQWEQISEQLSVAGE
ncbi:ABC-F family ATP-binding cassette domain-containing protein [bacterium]|nr:ABC-F family ATP-binding cassette domain-containing protein [bacterium]